ncbi:MAG: DNA topology modulation protein [Rubrivivax sp.]|nr:DNA topology modulation protein [Pyrinomonadaceae bacterium]
MRRILVIGSGGAGKSTFSRRLSDILDIEVVHLDKEHWKSGWVEPPKDVWRRKVVELVGGNAWIMDGNFSGTLDVRIAACDTVVFLDLPRALCLWRVLKRVAKYRGTHRPDMAEGCHEKLDISFLLWIWNYPSRTRSKVLGLIEEHSRNKRIVHLRSRAAVEKFLSELAARERTGGVRAV